MSRLANRSQLMAYLGAKQKNVVWSWCAVDEDSRKVYFSLWADSAEKRDGQRLSYVVQKPHWGVNKETGSHSAARKDHDEKLGLVFDQGYEAFGYLIDPKDPKAKQREIGGIRTSFIISLKLERREDGYILGYPLNRIEIR